jgi:hypothetical protein
MKRILITLAILFSIFAKINGQVERFGIKGPLQFNNIPFELSWTNKPNDEYLIQEYLPKGEKIGSYNQMLTIHLFVIDLKIVDAVKQKINELKERQKTDPVCNYQVSESPDGKEFIVDFLLSEIKDDLVSIVEFNVYRYKKVEISKKKYAIEVYAYTKRSYGDAITSFMQGLGSERADILSQMIAVKFPKIAIDNK